MAGNFAGIQIVNITAVIDALAIPPNALVNQRIPKKLLVEQGAPTAADKRYIQDGIEDLHWVAALKPANIGVPTFQNEEREYLEVTVLTAVFRQNAKAPRLIELIHRAIPYPLLLVSSLREGGSDGVTISAGHKRFAQNEARKVVVDEILAANIISLDRVQNDIDLDFLKSLALVRLSTQNLYLLYQGWLNSIVGFSAAAITGRFDPPDSLEKINGIRKFTAYHFEILNELSVLRTQAGKEKQINRLVELNNRIKQLELRLAENQSKLK